LVLADFFPCIGKLIMAYQGPYDYYQAFCWIIELTL
jgi:hypothetical protein